MQVPPNRTYHLVVAVIVEHTETQTLYVVVGTGYALGSRSREDAYPLVACSDGDGKISWFYSSQLSVELVDGRRPDDVLVEAEGIVYDQSGAKATPTVTAEVERKRDEVAVARARVEEARAKVEEASAGKTTPSFENLKQPPVDPKEVVGTSADLWRDDRPL